MVDLKPFACTNSVSSFVQRVRYDQRNHYMLIDLSGSFYYYCAIDGGTVSALLNADSNGRRFFNAAIKGRFDCRMGGMPTSSERKAATSAAVRRIYPSAQLRVHEGGRNTDSDLTTR